MQAKMGLEESKERRSREKWEQRETKRKQEEEVEDTASFGDPDDPGGRHRR